MAGQLVELVADSWADLLADQLINLTELVWHLTFGICQVVYAGLPISVDFFFLSVADNAVHQASFITET